MAKRKRVAAGKKSAKKKVSRRAVPAFNEDELCASAVVTWGGEGLLEATEYLHFDACACVSEFPVTVEQVSANSSSAVERAEQAGWDYARRLLQNTDYADMPHLRVFGRVIDILLNHRGEDTCSVGDVLRVFLAEIPTQLEETHRQRASFGSGYDVTRQPARRTFNNRMQKLCKRELVQPTIAREAGRVGNYVLTEDGQNIFDGWPPLSEIPGLEPNPEND